MPPGRGVSVPSGGLPVSARGLGGLPVACGDLRPGENSLAAPGLPTLGFTDGLA
jgi:hypothetical protein